MLILVLCICFPVLMCVLTQVALNKAYVESLDSASELLRGTMTDHDSLHQEVCLNLEITLSCQERKDTQKVAMFCSVPRVCKMSYSPQLKTARRLLQRATPILVKLNEKAANAIGERDQHLSERDQAVEEREQV